MLYLSTRSKTDSFTSHRVLHELRAPDGGCFVPFRMPDLREHISTLETRSFGENVAYVLGLFFATGISGWDVDCTIGKNAAHLTSMRHRVVIARLWNNPAGEYNYIVEQLYRKLTGQVGKGLGSWVKIAIRIAVLGALTGEMLKLGVEEFDVAAPAGDFSLPIAAWYGRKMGLPIHTIVCACNENSACWDLLHLGEMDTGASVVRTVTPQLDHQNPAELERLIYGVFGVDETLHFLKVSEAGKTYAINPFQLTELNSGFFACVVGQKRVEPVISNVFRTSGFVLDPNTAVAYGGLQDYRAKTGESKTTLLISDISPMHASDLVCHAAGFTKEDLKKHI